MQDPYDTISTNSISQSDEHESHSRKLLKGKRALYKYGFSRNSVSIPDARNE